MNIKSKKPVIIVLSIALLSFSECANAANDSIYASKVAYKSNYIYVPGSTGSHDLWGHGASPEQIWNCPNDLEFQTFVAGLASIGTSIANAAVSAASAIGSAVSSVVSAAGGIASVVSGAVPLVLGLGKDLLMSRIAAADASSTASAENKAILARLKVQTEADKAIAKQAAESNAAAQKIMAEEETKRATEVAKINAEKELLAKKMELEAAAKGKADSSEDLKKIEAAKAKLSDAGKKDEKASKDLKTKVDDLGKAIKDAKNTVNNTVNNGAAATTSALSPEQGIISTFTAEDEKIPADKSQPVKMDAKKFQEVTLNQAKTEKKIGVVAEQIKKQSDTFDAALKELLKAKTAGLSMKDMEPLIKAVDSSWDKLQKLYDQTDEAKKTYDELTAETDDLNFDDDALLDELIGDESNQPERITEAEFDAELDKVVVSDLEETPEGRQLLDVLKQDNKEMDEADKRASEK